jgi:hypothetical protein
VRKFGIRYRGFRSRETTLKTFVGCVVAAFGAFVSGLFPSGRLLTSAARRPVVNSTPHVTWLPVVGCERISDRVVAHDLPLAPSWSHRHPIHLVGAEAGAGLWYYRVRGSNGAQVGTPAMTWSAPVAVKVARPTFQISR